jgi:transcriptional regulator with XRE-family HTH domain
MSTGTLRHRVAGEVRAELARQRRSASWLARETDMGQTAVSRRLIGDVPLDLDDLERFAAALNVPVTQFVGWNSEVGGRST